MAHLDTAYKLGALRAVEDFQVELQKQSARTVLPDLSGGTAPPTSKAKPIPAPPMPPAQKRPAPKAPPMRPHVPSAPPA